MEEWWIFEYLYCRGFVWKTLFREWICYCISRNYSIHGSCQRKWDTSLFSYLWPKVFIAKHTSSKPIWANPHAVSYIGWIIFLQIGVHMILMMLTSPSFFCSASWAEKTAGQGFRGSMIIYWFHSFFKIAYTYVSSYFSFSPLSVDLKHTNSIKHASWRIKSDWHSFWERML